MSDRQSDEALLHAFCNGDRDALGELAERYERPLLGMALGLAGGSRTVACELVQETWLCVIRSARSYRRRSSVKTWLYTILINRGRSWYAAQRGKAVHACLDVHHSASDSTAAPDASIRRSEQRARLTEALDQLPPARREVLVLCYHHDMTHEMAAEILRIPLGTLKSRLHSGLQELRQQLAAEVSR
ncbi:MAG: RNA polymerase sigma factor [Phycisphaerales bacterium]|nr:RNA polymerase sigma factor [Phycisphaerales bacterium]